jgi:PIN domain nuclease of toxin-antitoxin system
MKLLLDTHIWVWSLVDPDRLAVRVREALEKEDHELWLSPICVWEALLLLERGRISSPLPPQETVARMLVAGPFREAPLTHAVALESRRLDLPHDDPADRFIAATAVVHGLTLVTADHRLLASNAYPVLGHN